MTSANDCADFSGAIEGRVLESHLEYLDKLPEPDTLCIYMTRGERRVRESVHKAFGNVKRVVIDVDGEKHEYDADALIALLEELEVRDAAHGTLTAEQVREAIERHVKFYEGGDYNEQAIADELNAELRKAVER